MNPKSQVSIASVYEPHYGQQILLFLAFLIPAIFFLLTEHLTLKRIRPENRKMSPGLIWLQLIPLLGQIWQFYVVVKIAGSINKEVISWYIEPLFGVDAVTVERGNRRPTQAMGLTYCTLSVAFPVLSVVSVTGLIWTPADHAYETAETTVGFLAFVCIACWIIYWVQLVIWGSKLKRGRPALA